MIDPPDAIAARRPYASRTEATVAELEAEAVRRAGGDDFGPDDYREPLTRLVAGVAGKPGRRFLHEELINALAARLIREAEWRANPGYRGRAIAAPLVICGIPRTGTTALHKLLAVDSQFQGLDHWLTTWPKPRPPRAAWPQEQGFLNAVELLRKRFADSPGTLVSHEVVADEVDECLEILRLDFVTNRFPSMTSLPDYDRWLQSQDETFAYRRFVDTLRLIGIGDDRTWLLKNPGHFGHLDELLAVLPDARVIITHRDPAETIGSLCSVLEQAHTLIDADADLTTIGKRELAYWAAAKRATERTRARHPAEQFLDVDHADFHADPLGTVARIYRRFGLALRPEVAAAMRGWLDANPAGKHGEHRYTLERYGIGADAVRAALATAA